jgi:hypothetical protein
LSQTRRFLYDYSSELRGIQNDLSAF